MKEVFDRVFITNLDSCILGFDDDMAVVHACKSPCHQTVVGYKGNLKKTHKNYLVLEEKSNLYLNMVDPKIPLFMPQSFVYFMKFAIKHYDSGEKLVIHCNLGQSRAPSLALLFLAKHLSVISCESYMAAKEHFEIIYPKYAPGLGIKKYLSKNWDSVGEE